MNAKITMGPRAQGLTTEIREVVDQTKGWDTVPRILQDALDDARSEGYKKGKADGITAGRITGGAFTL